MMTLSYMMFILMTVLRERILIDQTFHRMIADIEDNKVNCVVVKDLSVLDEITLIRGDIWKEYFQSLMFVLFL